MLFLYNIDTIKLIRVHLKGNSLQLSLNWNTNFVYDEWDWEQFHFDSW